MYSIGAIAAVGADGVGELTSRLPWGWFTLMAVIDVALIAFVVARRLHGRLAGRAPARPDALILRSGWWVPPSRVAGLAPQRSTYIWPLHREYMVCRLV
jgi:hypothetical protein